MATKVIIAFETTPEMKKAFEKKFENLNTNYSEVMRGCVRYLLDMPEKDLKDFVLKAKMKDAEENLMK